MQDNKYFWPDGTPLLEDDWNNWSGSEPNRGVEQCAYLTKDAAWNDNMCTTNSVFCSCEFQSFLPGKNIRLN